MNTESVILTKMAKTNKDALTLFKVLQSRQRMRKVSDVRRLTGLATVLDKTITEARVLKVLKELEKGGIGKVRPGSETNPNRFGWNFNLRQVAEVALNGETKHGLKMFGAKKEKKEAAPISEPVTKKSKVIVRKAQPVPQAVVAAPVMAAVAAPVPEVAATQIPVKAEVVKALAPMISLNIQLPEHTSIDEIRSLLELAAGLKRS